MLEQLLFLHDGTVVVSMFLKCSKKLCVTIFLRCGDDNSKNYFQSEKLAVSVSDVAVARTDVAVARTGVAVARTGVAVARTGVAVARTGVAVALAPALPGDMTLFPPWSHCVLICGLKARSV